MLIVRQQLIYSTILFFFSPAACVSYYDMNDMRTQFFLFHLTWNAIATPSNRFAAETVCERETKYMELLMRQKQINMKTK